MHCPHCSAPVDDFKARDCPVCGRPLDPVALEIRRIPWAAMGWLSLIYAAPLATWIFTGLVSRNVALTGMILSVACAVGLALRKDIKILAALGLTGGFLIPILMDSGTTAPATLYSVILVLDLAALAMAVTRGWSLLTKIAFAATWLILATTYIPLDPGGPFTVRLGFVNAFLMLFILWPMAEDLRGVDTLRNRDAFLPLAAGLFALGLSYPLIERNYGVHWCAALTMGYFVLFFTAAATLFLLGRRRRSSFGPLALSSALYLALSFVIAFAVT